MLDPKSVTQNLARDFPGLPNTDSPWTREATISGIDFTLVQTCAKTKEKPRIRWVCTGNTPSAGNQRGRLLDLNTETTIEVDRDGMIKHVLTYDGVIVRADSTGSLSHHAIAGKRAVLRDDSPKQDQAPTALQDSPPSVPQ